MYASKFRSSDGFIIFVVGVAVFTDMLLYGLIVPMLPYALADRVGIAPEDVQRWNSILLASFGAALMLGSLVVGWIGDRTSTRQIPFLFGLIALALSTLGIALTRDLVTLLIARILQGLSGAIVATVGYAILFDVVGSKDIGQALGFASMSQSFGLLIGPAIGGIIYEHGGYFKTFIPAFALIAFEIALRFLVTVRRKREKEASLFKDLEEQEASKASLLAGRNSTNQCYGSDLQQPSSDAGNPTMQIAKINSLAETHPPPATHTSSIYQTVGILLSHPRILVALVSLFVLNTVLTAYDATIPVYIHSTFSLTATHASFLFFIQVAPFLLAPIAGYITDRHGAKTPATVGLALLVPPVFVLQYVTAGVSSPFLVIGILLFITGLATAICLPALMAEVSNVVESIEKESPGIFGEQGVVAFSFGVINTAFGAGFFAGPALAGWLMGTVGWKGLNFVLSASGLVCVLGAGIYTGGPIWKTKQGSEAAVAE
ncbi:MAG: hypothetical protein Q9219_005842 [cf. Caloplaca sp. 3 TL-2023]